MKNFKKEVLHGLESQPKLLPSKYFYDEKGDALFVEIMNLPEYYLTRSELDIFKNRSNELVKALQIDSESYFELIELGAGDGLKTKELLHTLNDGGFAFDYFPIDISNNSLSLLKKDLTKEMPGVTVQTQQGDYFEILDNLKKSNKPKVIMFLGSNIGNMTDDLATKFIYQLGTNLNSGDKVLLGVDLIKSKNIVLPAYNDNRGITAKFNLNLLNRINNELEGNFNLNQFKHKPEYDEKEGIAKSYIVSQSDQIVKIKSLDREFNFTKGEKIQTEISRKYNDEIINKMIADTDFSIETKVLDSKAYFASYILTRN